MQATIHQFYENAANDLRMTQAALLASFQSRSIDAISALPSHALLTSVAAAVALHVLFVCSTRKGRRILVDIADTVAALALITVLLAIILGLPIAIFYLSIKSIWFLLTSVLAYISTGS